MLKLHYGMVCYVGGVPSGRGWALASGVTAKGSRYKGAAK